MVVLVDVEAVDVGSVDGDGVTVVVDAVVDDGVLGVLVTVLVDVAPPQDGAVEGKVQIASSGSKIPIAHVC